MKKFLISDKSLKLFGNSKNINLSFSEKINIAETLDSNKTDVICLGQPVTKTDMLFVKTVSATVKRSILSVDAGCSVESVNETWKNISGAVNPALNICFPMSIVRLEYICHMKPTVALDSIKACVAEAKTKGCPVFFTAEDAGRAEKSFLYSSISVAIECGADYIVISDEASGFAFDEYETFIKGIYENVPAIADKKVIADISNGTGMTVASLYNAIKQGCDGVTVAVGSDEWCDYAKTVDFLVIKGEQLGISLNVYTSVTKKNTGAIAAIAAQKPEQITHKVDSLDQNITLSGDADEESVYRAVENLGYSLSDSDKKAVWEAFSGAAHRKETISAKELDAIVAGAEMNVPATYEVKSFVINTGNVLTSTANISIEKDGKLLTGVYVGDGPIDAAFNAIEMIVGHHYELDDFQIQAITEGRQALGRSVVCLRSTDGKLFSGTGISSDIIGASILAYVSALNKIAFEETK